MKRIILFLCLIVFMVIPVYADLQMPQIYSWEEETARDFNGNLISDCWAYDPSQETEKFVKLDSEGHIIEKKETFEEEGASTGWIEVEAILPDELKGYDVVIGITGPDSYQIILYGINNHKARQEVIAGTYKIETAMISGDYKGEYLATFPDEIEVYENSTAAVLKTDFTKEEIEEPETTIQETPDPVIEEEKPEKRISILQIIVISIFVLIIVGGIYIFKKIRDNS